MDSPNQKVTRFLKLRYLDPSQAQPEVKINEAWDILDEAIENGLPINTGGGSSGGGGGAGSITVIGTGSPDETISDVTTLRFIDALVESETGGVANVRFISAPALEVVGLGDSPHEVISAVSVIRFSGAVQVTEESDGSVLVCIDARDFILPAGWNSSSGAVPIAVTVPQDLMLPRAATLTGVFIQTQGPAGSCTISLSESAFPFVSGADITGGSSPAIASGTSYSNTALAGWTLHYAQGAIIRATLTANVNFTSIKIFLRFT